MKHIICLPVFCLLLSFASGAMADQLVLENGDRISGNLLRMSDGVLEIETTYAGVIKVKWDEVAQISTEAPAKVKLLTGEVITGSLAVSEAGTVVAESPAVGKTKSIPLAQVASINEPPAKWGGYFDIGSTYRTGNVETLDARLRVSMVRETKQDRISADASWSYEESEGTLTARNAAAQVKYDYFPWKKTYVYAATSLETDEFKDLNLRTKLGVGLGRRFIREPKRTLEGEVGVTYINDDFEIAADEDTIALRLFGKYTRALLENLNFMQSLEALPSVEDTSDVRLTAVTEFSTRLSARWSAVWTLIDEYDSEPSPGFKKNDFASILSLRCTF